MPLMDHQSPWLDDDEQELWEALLTVVIALPAALDRQLRRDADISNFDYGVLARLSRAESATMRLSELARLSDSPLPRLSKVMDRFEARDWVIRKPDPDDGRYTLATLRPKGRKKLVECAPGHAEQVRRLVLDPLSATQRRHLSAAAARIAATLREDLDCP